MIEKTIWVEVPRRCWFSGKLHTLVFIFLFSFCSLLKYRFVYYPKQNQQAFDLLVEFRRCTDNKNSYQYTFYILLIIRIYIINIVEYNKHIDYKKKWPNEYKKLLNTYEYTEYTIKKLKRTQNKYKWLSYCKQIITMNTTSILNTIMIQWIQ